MISPNWYPDRRQLRQFAVICLFGFGLFGLMAWRWTGSWTAAIVLWSIGAAALVVGVPFPNAVRLLYVALTALALPIGWLVSQILLRALFYLVFTPLGLLFRMMGRDPLRLRRPAAESYWLVRVQRTDALSYYRQA